MNYDKIKSNAGFIAIIGILVLSGMAVVCERPQPPKPPSSTVTATTLAVTSTPTEEPTVVPVLPTETPSPMSIFVFPTQEVRTPTENPTEVPGDTPTAILVPPMATKDHTVAAPVQVPR